jgi:hypothetical protein
MERGFFHPEQGYWQTNGPVPQETIDGYPAGTAETIPLRPHVGTYDWVDGAWVAVTVGASVDELAAYAAVKRRALVSGAAVINVGSRSIPTWVDAESRGAITGLVVAGGLIEGLTAPWKGSDGHFYTLTSVEITVMALGMMQFVQDCFAVEAAVLAAIGAETVTTFADIDAASWPA